MVLLLLITLFQAFANLVFTVCAAAAAAASAASAAATAAAATAAAASVQLSSATKFLWVTQAGSAEQTCFYGRAELVPRPRPRPRPALGDISLTSRCVRLSQLCVGGGCCVGGAGAGD